MSLDERLENVTKGMKTVNDLLEPLLQSVPTPTPMQNGESSEHTLLLRKHATLASEWESVQDESEVLREELKEDKWLTVFRTVTEQADGMMSSLEKAVNRCQVCLHLQNHSFSLKKFLKDFIWQVHRHGADDLHSSTSSSNSRTDKAPLTIEVYNSLLESFEAKKKCVSIFLVMNKMLIMVSADTTCQPLRKCCQ